ncbi:hypothetical protein NEDG_01098 [Nematocida displodere]|uniref:ATP-binding protein involved in chromosome partitioning n=1 Tax=Nematocida displodere TaxID=1805483 RepID=A0A177ED84_9MICR|nr:hypothetical protein NEDG_01098 [Nematocida displodere]
MPIAQTSAVASSFSGISETSSPQVLLIGSGKGGVGKSTFSAMLSKGLSEHLRVLLLDFDLCGPSIGILMGDKGEKVFKGSKGLVPLEHSPTLHYLSIASLIPTGSAVIWRAPKKIGLLGMFADSIDSTKYDWVVIDLPPGITDEHVFAVERFPRAKALIVTTSQNLSLEEASGTISFLQKKQIGVVGVIENMSTFECPSCAECTPIFSKGGGKLLADASAVSYLGSIPVLPDTTIIPPALAALVSLLAGNGANPNTQ